ncbi:hypothetical protein ANRL4_01286 [Anaerolineae bacterium]|nr:hypothetical protein ANRL4_01286 [Anaerolineae bacterium]
MYLRARYYAPGLGVFPSLDPVEGVFDQPSSLNRYGYVQQNPVNWTDPSGRCTDPITCAILIGLGLAFLAGCATNSEDCSSAPAVGWEESIVLLGVGDAQGYEIGIGAYVDLGRNCFLTHSHWDFQRQKTKPEKLAIVPAIGSRMDFSWTQVSYEFKAVEYGQCLICLDGNANRGITVPPLKPLAISITPKDVLANCANGYNAYTIHQTIENGRFIPQLVKVEITNTIRDFRGFVLIDDGFEFRSPFVFAEGDSGSPIIANGQIVGIYAGGGGSENNRAAWVSISELGFLK